MDWYILVIFGVVVLALLVFLIKKNIKDEKDLENKIKQDYPKSRDEEDDVQIDEELK